MGWLQSVGSIKLKVSFSEYFLQTSFLQSQSTWRQISHRTVSRGEEETCVIHHSITDLWVVPEPSLIVTWIKQKNISGKHRNSKPPSGGTITTDRCLTHIRDAAHSENSGNMHSNSYTLLNSSTDEWFTFSDLRRSICPNKLDFFVNNSICAKKIIQIHMYIARKMYGFVQSMYTMINV